MSLAAMPFPPNSETPSADAALHRLQSGGVDKHYKNNNYKHIVTNVQADDKYNTRKTSPASLKSGIVGHPKHVHMGIKLGIMFISNL